MFIEKSSQYGFRLTIAKQVVYDFILEIINKTNTIPCEPHTQHAKNKLNLCNDFTELNLVFPKFIFDRALNKANVPQSLMSGDLSDSKFITRYNEFLFANTEMELQFNKVLAIYRLIE